MSARFLRLGALVFLLPGCGILGPTLYGPSVIAPDVVPPADASVALVTGQSRGRGIEGRVVDRDTGAALTEARLTARDADGTEASATTDARGAFRFSGLSGLASVRAESACHAALDARPAVGADSSATLLVLMAPVGCAR